MDRGKPIRYSRHAKLRMLERNFVGGMIEETLFHRERDYPGNIPGSVVAVKNFGSLELHVVYLESSECYLICSVFED